MQTIQLKKGDKFTIISYAHGLFFRSGHLVPTAPYTYSINKETLRPEVEFWEMNGEEDIKVNATFYVTSGNGLIFDSLAGQRPTKSRRSR